MSSLTSISGGASSESCAAPLPKLPPVCISHICGFLPPEDLANTSLVSKEWRVLGGANPELWRSPTLWDRFDLKDFFHARGLPLNVIDKKVWFDWTGLDIDESSFPDKRGVILGLKEMFASLEIEGDAGITLLTLPPVTLRELQEKFLDRIRYMYSRILDQHGDVAMTETRLVAITNNILKGSRGLSSSVQEVLVLGKGYQMIGVTAAVALAILTEKSSSVVPPTRLFGVDPYTYTRCAELVDGYRVVVGGFARSGLCVGDHDFGIDDDGVGCLRKF